MSSILANEDEDNIFMLLYELFEMMIGNLTEQFYFTGKVECML